MEEAYATAGVAILCLVSEPGEAIRHLESEAALRSVLQRRSVVLGYVVSSLAKKLREGAGRRPKLGRKQADPSTLKVPHKGIRLALEAVLEVYDPSTPHSVAAVVDAIGDDGLEAILHDAGGVAPLLPWTARLCLLHACLAGGSAGGRRWGWLPTVAESACSSALQMITTKGTGSGTPTGRGKGLARLGSAGGGAAAEAGKPVDDAGGTGRFSAAVMSRVCTELAAAEASAGSPPPTRAAFLGRCPGAGLRGVESGISSSPCGDVLAPGGRATRAFRLKLQALCDALSAGTESGGKTPDLQGPREVAGMHISVEDVYVKPEAVERALERSRCGETFVLAVQAVLEADLSPIAASASRKRKLSPNDGGGSVKLKHALEACLLGVGLPRSQGLLGLAATDDSELSFATSATEPRSTIGRRPSWVPAASFETGRACALMQGLVEEGIRIRDLLLTLLGMHEGRGRRLARSGPVESLSSRTGAEVVSIIRPARETHQRAVAEVIGAFVEWLADNPWAWCAAESEEDRDWEGDIVAAARVTAATFSAPPFADRGIGAESMGALLSEVPIGHETGCDGSGRGRVTWRGGVDATDLLDRLIAGAAIAVAGPEALEVDWVGILGWVTAATDMAFLSAYAATCVEKSAALGGQAPFRVAEKRRFSQAGGMALWGLLEGSCVPRKKLMAGGQEVVAVLIRTAAAAVAACRKVSNSWMIPSGLLGSGPVRVVIDMLSASEGVVAVSHLLGGLLARPGEEGPTFAADLFAALVAADAEASAGPESGSSGGGALHAQAVAWLGSVLSAACLYPHPPDNSSSMEGVIPAAALARFLTRRVPFEAKPVLLAVKEAADFAVGRSGARTRHASSRGGASARGGSLAGSNSVVASLGGLAHAAAESPLLPLSVPLLSPPPPRPDRDRIDEAPGAESSVATGGRKGVPSRDLEQADESAAAAVTAELLLSAFGQSPVGVIRTMRGAMQRRDCNHELLAVQRALRLALCTPPSRAVSGGDDEGTKHSLAELGARRASACLLVGHLVESGVPGWEETKAAMIPPPRHLIEAAETPVREEGASGLQCDSRQRLTALRLEMWLRHFLCDADGARFGVHVDLKHQVPDVFRTARTLARAISRHASALISSDLSDAGGQPIGHHGYLFDAGFGGVESRGDDFTNGDNANGRRGGGEAEHAVDGGLKPPRQALAGRLRGAPAAGALVSWLSSIVKTAEKYRQWLPWQAFADELRELMLLSVRQRARAPGGGRGDDKQAPLGAAASVFAVCEILLAWEGGEEVPAAVFRAVLCSTALNTAVAPVPRGVGPPIWLEVLRCLVDGAGCDVSGWTSYPTPGVSVQQGPLAVAAAAAVWIGGDGAGTGKSGERSAREAWVRWYGDKLEALVPPHPTGSGKWLILSGAKGDRDGGVQILAGVGWAAHTVKPQEWEDWGRSPLQAAWNFPAGCGVGCRGGSGVGSGPPPPIVLPPFAAWLRVVLRGGGPSCGEGLLEGYLRRMAREVYLPCEFGGASGEMARQWLGALIEAEAGAEARAAKNLALATAVSRGGGAVTPASPSSAGTAPARRLAVKAFFREELLRFGSGEAPAAPVGGPLTWLWPLEAVVTACGRAGALGCGMHARRRGGGRGLGGPGDTDARIVLDSPPSALARALCAVPHDLLCGSRRFGGGGGRPPPATLRAFATRAVDLAARALATPPCRHWSVARRLLLGLGLLYHALAKPEPTSSCELQRSPAIDQDTPVEATAGRVRADGEAAAARTAALSTIESLIRIALGFGREEDGLRNGAATRVDGDRFVASATSKPGTPMLPSACRTLRPLESGSSAGLEEFAEALRGAGAWRAATALFGRRKVAQPSPSPSAPPPPLPPPAAVDPQRRRQSSPERAATVEREWPVDARQDGRSTGARSSSDVNRKQQQQQRSCGSGPCTGSREVPVLAWRCPREQQNNIPSLGAQKKARLGESAEEGGVVSSPRRLVPVRSATRSQKGSGV